MSDESNVHINLVNPRNDSNPITLSSDASSETKKNKYFVNVFFSFLIYTTTFFVFYFLKNKSISLDADNLKLISVFLLSVVIASILSQKFNYIKLNEYGKTLGKVFVSLLMSLIVLIILLNIVQIQNKIRAYVLGALFSGFVIEALYFIMLGTKEKSKIKFFEYKNLSFKYFFIDLLILTFFCSVVIVPNLGPDKNIEKEFILVALIFISWLISAATTHKFLPVFFSNSRWNAFELQIKFYLRIFILILLCIIFLQFEYSSSIYFIKALIGYSLVSALVFMFIFAPKVENKTDEATVSFLKKYQINDSIKFSKGEIRNLKYSFTGPGGADSIGKQKIQFEYLKEYEEVFLVLNSMLDLKSFNTRETIIIKSDEPNDISLQLANSYQLFVNLHVLNDQSDLDNYLIKLRNSLVEGGVFVGAFYPHLYRYKRFLKKYSFWIGNTFYFFDLIWKRVFPKLPITREIYFIFRKDKDQAISLAEGLGRLVYAGYKILDLAVVDDVVYFAAVKDEGPAPQNKLFYSPIFKMKRIGKDGKSIYVYKLRTMYPYSEYIQDFVYKHNNLLPGGKIKDDFRVPFWGKYFRKLFIDELPMLVNWVKRDLKLVGVRPISDQYLSLYSKEHQARRKNYIPGLVPPFYADLPRTIEEIELSEKRYLDAYEKNPIKTDIKYFFKAMNNILLKKKRSS